MYGGGGIDHNQTLGGRLNQIMMPVHSTAALGGGDEDFPRRDERVLQWGQQETRDFIGIRAELEKDFNVSKRNKSLWEVVSCKMKERGFVRTPDQCKCKWKNLVMRYKVYKDFCSIFLLFLMCIFLFMLCFSETSSSRDSDIMLSKRLDHHGDKLPFYLNLEE